MRASRRSPLILRVAQSWHDLALADIALHLFFNLTLLSANHKQPLNWLFLSLFCGFRREVRATRFNSPEIGIAGTQLKLQVKVSD